MSENIEMELKFKKLCESWRTSTQHMSSVSDIVANESYQQIIKMGPDVIPLILVELQQKVDHWFWALSVLVGEDVATGAKTMEEARTRWLEWGKLKSF